MRLVPLFTALALLATLALPGTAATAQSVDALVEAEPASQTQTAPATQPAAAEAAEAEAEAPEPTKIGYLTLSGTLADSPPPFAWIADPPDSLRIVLNQIDHVANSDEHAGLFIFLDEPALSLTQVQALSKAIDDASLSGKKVLVFADTYDLRTYLLASAADEIVLQHKGSVALIGLSLEEMYLKGLLNKIGIQASFVQVGKFKGADEQLTRTGPSPEWSANMDNLLDGLYGDIEAKLILNTDLPVEKFDALMANAWTLTDKQLLEAGLVDQLVSRDVDATLTDAFGEDFEYDYRMGKSRARELPSNPFALLGAIMNAKPAGTRGPTLAVIHMTGPIMTGDSTIGDGFLSSDSIGSRTVLDALEEARDDDNIKGVILRLDSPGGSALASELIWQGVRDLAAEKPVYTSIGGMAASGGYYIASATEKIYAQPASILGSIGVVGGKLSMGGLYDMLGIGIHGRSRGPNADLFNSVKPFTPEQEDMVRKSMTVIYDQFLDRVTAGRGNRIADLDAVTQGRIFTGTQSIANGLADAEGGILEAQADLADQLGLDDYAVFHLPRAMGLDEYLNTLFGVSAPGQMTFLPSRAAASPELMAAKRLLSPHAWSALRRQLTAITQLQREPVLLLGPAAISIR
ncbi:MAG: S49 family peptidase [Planctomycetota bacterium]